MISCNQQWSYLIWFPANNQRYVTRQFTHWGRVTHIYVSDLTIIGSDNGLSPGRRQAIIWTNAGILLIGPLGTTFSDILIEIYSRKCVWKGRLRNGAHFVWASMWSHVAAWSGIYASGNGLSAGWGNVRPSVMSNATTCTDSDSLLITPLGTTEMWFKIQTIHTSIC